MSLSSALKYLDKSSDKFQKELIELLRIPSISHDTAYKADMDTASSWVADKLRSIGMNNVEILPTAGYPVVYGEWLNADATAPTVLIYGHYDVQSAEPLEDWKSDPFEPEIRDNNLYARGASDMKGQILAAVNAVEAMLKTDNLLLNIKFLIEGEEEIGSKNLNEFLIANREKLSADFSLNTDAGGMPDADTPSICYSLRGGARFELTLFGPEQDVHSGKYGGVIQNPIHVLSKLIADLHDEHGHIALPGFYDKVREIDADEHVELAKLPVNDAVILEQTGVPALWGEPGFIPAERIGARPAIDVVMFKAGRPKFAIPSKASALFVFRLVPDQDPDEVHGQFRQYLETHAPDTIRWDLQFINGSPGIITDRKLPAVLAMKFALEKVFGKTPIFQRVGGGISAVGKFKNVLGIDSVLTGFSLNDDNFHGPNEKLHLPTWQKGMQALVHFLHNVADM